MRFVINNIMSNKNIDFIKKGIKFKRKPAKMGDRYVFNIPQSYVENGLIDPTKTYMIYLANTDEKEEDEI